MPVERSSHPVAIVTGGSRGIGAAVTTALVACGYRVIITGRDHDRLTVTADRIGAEFLVADVTDVGSAERVVDETFDRHGRLDVLVNNAGISGDGGPLASGSVQAWWAVIEANLYGPMAFMHAALGHMIPARRGAIFNIGSYGGIRPLPGASAYGTSKAALARLTDSVALEVASAGVTVMCLSPGLVETDMTRGVSVFEDVPAEEWDSIDRIGTLIVELLGRDDLVRLNGRFVHVRDDFDALFTSIDRIDDERLYQLGLRGLSGPIE